MDRLHSIGGGCSAGWSGGAWRISSILAFRQAFLPVYSCAMVRPRDAPIAEPFHETFSME
jgi:hypothetical protein